MTSCNVKLLFFFKCKQTKRFSGNAELKTKVVVTSQEVSYLCAKMSLSNWRQKSRGSDGDRPDDNNT